jgi:hypothetical protein
MNRRARTERSMHIHRLAKEIREAVERGHLAFAVRLLGEHVISTAEREHDMASVADLIASTSALTTAVANAITPSELDPIKASIDAATTSLGGTPPAVTATPAAPAAAP